jgi:hypothetical protein
MVYQSLGGVGRSRKKEKFQFSRTSALSILEQNIIGWFEGQHNKMEIKVVQEG